MMFLKKPSGLILLALRTHVELPPYSQRDTNIFLSHCFAYFPIFSDTLISGMEFDLENTSDAGVCRYELFHSED